MKEKYSTQSHEKWLLKAENDLNAAKLLYEANYQDVATEEIVRAVPYQITTPTLIFQGSEDPVFGPDHGEALAAAIKGSQYVFVKDMGHAPTRYFDDFIVEHLKRHAKLKTE